jgi:hypothetical protein
MKYILSRFNHDLDWLKEYSEDYVLYDRSPEPLPDSIIVPNIGSDIYDKFTYIIDNYDSLPDVAVYTKANLLKYISKEELDKVKDNITFTPLLTQNHKTYLPVCYYENGMYWEINNMWYLSSHPCKHKMIPFELQEVLGIGGLEYVPFAPGSNYILPKENILKHSKGFYIKLRSYLEWDVYPGEAQIIERGLYTLWNTQ